MDHPKCPKCGGEEFQCIEDVPRKFTDHVFVDGTLYFNADQQEMCWDGCAGEYQYVECASCCTKLEGVQFGFDDSMQREADAIGEMS